MIKKILIISLCIITLFLLTIANHRNTGIGLKKDYLENEEFWNDIRDISFSKFKELNVSYICINSGYHTTLKGERYRLWIKKNNTAMYFENLTDIFTEEEAEKVETVFKRKVTSIQLGYTLVGANTLVFYGRNYFDSYSALFYSKDDGEISFNKERKIIPIKEQWYLLHSS